MANTSIPVDVTELRVSVIGAQKGMLDASPGVSGTFAGTSGTNSVTVAAKFGNGTEKVVYMGSIGKIFLFFFLGEWTSNGWLKNFLCTWINHFHVVYVWHTNIKSVFITKCQRITLLPPGKEKNEETFSYHNRSVPCNNQSLCRFLRKETHFNISFLFF
jgi:hypothetical protein